MIAMIIPQWLKTTGGPTNYVKNLAAKLMVEGHQVRVLTCEQGLDVLSFRNSPFLREFDIIRFLVEVNPDIIHIHGSLHYILPAKIYKSLLNNNTRIVLTFHTQPHFRNFLDNSKVTKGDYPGVKRALARVLLAWCDSITAVSGSLILNLNKYCSLAISKYSVIQSGGEPNSTDLGEIEAFRNKHALHSECPVLSTIGMFSWDWKVAGHKIAIEAVNILREKYPDIKLLIAGDGAYRDYLLSIVENRDVKDNIVFCGNMKDPNVILQLSDIYVHMAMNEGSPLSVIEAMFAQKPIVAVEMGGIVEIIHNNYNGVLIQPVPQELAEAVNKLLRDKERCQILADNAFAYAKEKLNWRAIAQRYIHLYAKGA